jgi:hypothetical protein
LPTLRPRTASWTSMLFPKTADSFLATVSALRSLDGSKGVSFHTFSLPEDRRVRLLLKNISANTCLRASFGRNSRLWAFMSRTSYSSALGAAIRM